jgi:hypothetical protein
MQAMFGSGTNHNRKSARLWFKDLHGGPHDFPLIQISLSHLRPFLLNLRAAGAWFGSVLVFAGEVRALLYYKTPTSPCSLQIILSFTYRGINPDIGARTPPL